MLVRLCFKTLSGEVIELISRFEIFYNSFYDIPEKHFKAAWEKCFPEGPENYALKIEESEIIFLPDRTLCARDSIVDGIETNVFLKQYGLNICAMPKFEDGWKISMKVIPRGKIQ